MEASHGNCRRVCCRPIVFCFKLMWNNWLEKWQLLRSGVHWVGVDVAFKKTVLRRAECSGIRFYSTRTLQWSCIPVSEFLLCSSHICIFQQLICYMWNLRPIVLGVGKDYLAHTKTMASFWRCMQLPPSWDCCASGLLAYGYQRCGCHFRCMLGADRRWIVCCVLRDLKDVGVVWFNMGF